MDVTVGFWVLSIDTINVIDMVSNERKSLGKERLVTEAFRVYGGMTRAL